MIHCLLPTIHHNGVLHRCLFSSSTHVTSRDGNSLNLLKLLYYASVLRIVQHCSSFFGFHIVHPHSSTYIVHPHKKRIPLKPVNSFIFVCSRRCKNSSPAFPLAYKSTAAVCVCYSKITNRYSVANLSQVHVTTFVSVVSRFCCVHFLTFVSNSSIFQRAKSGKPPPFRFCCFGASSVFLSAKLQPLYLTAKYFLLKNMKR